MVLQPQARGPIGSGTAQSSAGALHMGGGVGQARDRGRRVVGVEGRDEEVTGERGLDGDVGRLLVADFADEDDVEVGEAVAARLIGGMAALAEELAAVVAHEMAHNLLDHRARINAAKSGKTRITRGVRS